MPGTHSLQLVCWDNWFSNSLEDEEEALLQGEVGGWRRGGLGEGRREVIERTADDNYNRTSVRMCCTLLLLSVCARASIMCACACVRSVQRVELQGCFNSRRKEAVSEWMPGWLAVIKLIQLCRHTVMHTRRHTHTRSHVGKRWFFCVSPVYFIPAASPLSSWLGERRFKLNFVRPVLFFCFLFFTGLLTWRPPPLLAALTQITEHPGRWRSDARSTRCISCRIWIDNVIYLVPPRHPLLAILLFNL